MIKIDCRKMDCPAPVISVKRALESETELVVLVDDGAPRENVTRFAKNRGFLVTEEKDSNCWAITIRSTNSAVNKPVLDTSKLDRVVLITSDKLGDGPEELGQLLMKNFIHTLLETDLLPSKIFFMNRGVLLTCEGSDLVEALNKLVNIGVELYSCGLCLDFFGLKEKLRVGATTNMLTTAESLLSATQVIKL
jgi:selenium metabolism protein YedF